MDAPTPQTWGLGLKPKIGLTIPPSFIIFFPVHRNGTSTDGKGLTGRRFTNMAAFCKTWVGLLRAPIPFQREPAWHRVATEYFSAKDNVTRTIMRRISLSSPHLYRNRFVLSSQKELAEAKLVENWTEPTKCKMPPQKSFRRNSYKSDDSLIAFCGQPESQSQVAHMLLEARVDFANGILQIPKYALIAEVKALKSRQPTSSLPTKRRIDKHDCIAQDGILGGFRLFSYNEVLPILHKATDTHLHQIDLLSASIAEVAANFVGIGCRSPRIRVARLGVPNLPDIADKTESLSTVGLAGLDDESGKSPTKKSPRSIAPLKASPRLSHSVVKLLPATAPQVESSPVKPLGPSSTPFVNSPCPVKLTQSPSLQAPTITPGELASPLTYDPSLAPGPTKHFCAPSYDSSSSSLDSTMSPVKPSPVKLHNFAPRTPSRLAITELATPSDSATETQNGSSELGLMASVSATAPQLTSSPLQPVTAVDPAQLSFGPSSPTFNSASWLNSTATSRAKQTVNLSTKSTGRRKSEPLLRSCILNQAARRQTISPRKYVFDSDGVFDKAASPAATPELEHNPPGNPDASVQVDLNQTPQHAASADASLSMMTPAISWGKLTGRISGHGLQITPDNKPVTTINGVHNVDMRQNLDIFGAPATSSTINPPAVDQLAKMVAGRCDGQAKVLVTEENGRLIVRFKLPTEYSYLFPNSQGADDSHFTTPPSAISTSPRISFEGYKLELPKEKNSPQREESNSPLPAHNENPSSNAPSFSTATSPVATVDEKQKSASTPSPPPELNTSFTPVNQSGSRGEAVLARQPPTATQEPKVTEHELSTRQGDQSLQSNHYEDSPGRDYMRDFIKRTHRKRLSTELGSPIAPPAKRAPLGIKSPNVESPVKGKRKAENLNQNSIPSLRSINGPLPKRLRRADKLSPEDKTPTTIKSQGKADKTKPIATSSKAAVPAHGITTNTDDKDDQRPGTGSGTRRSTRLRSLQPSSTAKSSIPTSIKLGGRPNTVRGILNPVTRAEEKELSNKTRKNTLKNKGNAEYPAQVLARCQEERLREESGEENHNPEAPAKVADGRKCVGWKHPLEAHQGGGAKRSRIATYKSKSTAQAGSSSIARPARSTAGQKQQHAAKVAETLGMSQNGTPAKPNRVTRSSARVRA